MLNLTSFQRLQKGKREYSETKNLRQNLHCAKSKVCMSKLTLTMHFYTLYLNKNLDSIKNAGHFLFSFLIGKVGI